MNMIGKAAAIVGFGLASSCAGPAENDIGTATTAEDLQSVERGRAKYVAVNLASLGGTRSGGIGINDLNWVTGFSNVAGDQERHATVWQGGLPLDLGTLGGLHSSIVFPVESNRGLVVGIAETAEDNPLGEAWSCSAFFPTTTHKVCRGFAWQNGVMRALPTFGGYNGFAAGANDRMQIVGWAENTVRDPTCAESQVLQFRAAIWGPGENQMQELPPLPNHSTSAAVAINEKGQVVGISGDCDVAVGRFSARDAVLWDHGKAIKIGGLGGVAWNTAVAINERGDVVGFSNVDARDGGEFREQAFLWNESRGIKSLGTLPGDVFSQATDINDRRQIVGQSCSESRSCRAFVWQDGVMTDLNTLLAPGFTYQLVAANNVNELGVITGVARNPSTGERRAFMAIPFR